jgi:uncharacterized protein YndB with AHSA1/START domain
MSSNAGEATLKIDLAWDLPHPPSKVWRALTDPELVAQWLMQTDLKLEKGRRCTFKAEPTAWWDGIVQSKVIEFELERKLVLGWGGGPVGLESRVTWTLTPTASGTHLALEHTGFKADQPQAYGGAKFGWERNVNERMKKLLDTIS